MKDIRKQIEKDIIRQLKSNGTDTEFNKGLVNDYMELWDIKNKLIDDINLRGVSVMSATGVVKKNESVSELNKTSAQMLKILIILDLKSSKIKKDEDYDL